MKNPSYLIFLGILSTALLFGCAKSTETVVIDSGGLTTSTPRSEAKRVNTSSLAPNLRFVYARIGELADIHTFDPLFITNNTEKRVLGQVYEGLTSRDLYGNIKPGLAKKWRVNRDSTEYTFTLSEKAFFHPSEVFASGAGRRVVASDIRYVFERMAMANVPEQASLLFEDIEGFDVFKAEQHQVKIPDQRAYRGVSGIEIENDSTIVFTLDGTSAGFLQRLSDPVSAIYPRESVDSRDRKVDTPVGTGPFSVLRVEQNKLILTSNEEYRDTPPITDRIDIEFGLSEKELFQKLAREELDVLIELGPLSMESMLDGNQNLSPAYLDSYNLERHSSYTEYPVYYNPASKRDNEVARILSSVETVSFSWPAQVEVYFPEGATSVDTTTTEKENVISATVTHPFEMALISEMAKQAASQNLVFSLMPSYAITESVSISTRWFNGLQRIASLRAPYMSLSNKRVQGIRFGNTPGNVDFTQLRINQDP
ncbi:MAG: ABC transporter substrate-binding protein [Bacteroidota bacterium]